MSQVTQLIQNRRTIHHFKPDAVPYELIEKALKLSVFAPNHHHTQPCRFYLLGEKSKTQFLQYAEKEFSSRDPQTAEKKLNRWRAIPGWVLATRKVQEDEKTAHEDYATLSIALYIMMQSLTEDGIGSKWSTGSLLFKKEVYAIFGINPQEEVIEGMFWYGYPDKTPLPFPKQSYHDFVTELN
ncbi:nitroreductase family protein [Ignatzschineria rhizosphaerae]|uniref:Nitroreductase family protein n=1 Tax=Ignatzschineria rhizosphaerae TaxID=2923279 RepID=A0ABY3X2J9_9GAMM|nr:nitroreductase family protein [Ignatzschineria rhizosphaerae]UNM97091.1 nitroreductase family protein [Ignatzschineria rhizosphaerae]